MARKQRHKIIVRDGQAIAVYISDWGEDKSGAFHFGKMIEANPLYAQDTIRVYQSTTGSWIVEYETVANKAGKGHTAKIKNRAAQVLSYRHWRLAPGIWRAKSPNTGDTYTVDINNGNCTCPATKNPTCKHLMAAVEWEQDFIQSGIPIQPAAPVTAQASSLNYLPAAQWEKDGGDPFAY